MAQMKEMVEMNRLVGEILKVGNKFLQEYKANEAKRSELARELHKWHSQREQRYSR